MTEIRWFMRDAEGDEYEMVFPAMIDTKAYSDRDREMFVLGMEMGTVMSKAMDNPASLEMMIHNNNEDRIRLALNKIGRPYEFERIDDQWSRIKMEEADVEIIDEEDLERLGGFGQVEGMGPAEENGEEEDGESAED